MKRGIPSILAALVLILAGPVCAAFETDEPVDFSLPGLDGEPVSTMDYRGQWVVLNYWATWCAPCRKEMPELSELHLARADVTVLGLAFEDIDPAEFEPFLEELTVEFPVMIVDVYNPPQPFGAPKVLPTTIVLDHEGRAVKSFVGPVTREAIEDFIGPHAD